MLLHLSLKILKKNPVLVILLRALCVSLYILDFKSSVSCVSFRHYWKKQINSVILRSYSHYSEKDDLIFFFGNCFYATMWAFYT